jgi:hypothetical protein
VCRAAGGRPPCTQAFQYGTANKTKELESIAQYYEADTKCIVLFDDRQYNQKCALACRAAAGLSGVRACMCRWLASCQQRASRPRPHWGGPLTPPLQVRSPRGRGRRLAQRRQAGPGAAPLQTEG